MGEEGSCQTITELLLSMMIVSFNHSFFFPSKKGFSLTQPVYVIIEDLTYGKQHPSVLDLKIGKTTWHPDSPHEKRKKMEKKDSESTSGLIGARMIGFSVRLLFIHF